MASLNFRARVLDSQGTLQVLAVLAESEEVARTMLLEGGGILISIEELGAATHDSSHGGVCSEARSWMRTSSRALDIVSFSQDLATLLSAGVSVREAIHALATREADVSRQIHLLLLRTLISEGLPLSAAMKEAGDFPEVMIATVAASEQTGDLAIGLTRYAQHQQNLRAVRDKVIGASVYPMLLLVLGTAIVMMLLGVVVPRFADLIDINGRELPALSKILMSWGHFAAAHRPVVWSLFAGVGLLVLWLVFYLQDPRHRRQLLDRIPGFSKIAREFQHLQLYRTTAILTSRGITIQKALPYAANLLNPADQVRLAEALTGMREGTNLSLALSRCGLADIVATSMLVVAERTGSLPEMLDRVADFYERALQRRIDIVSRLIEPVMMIIFGVLVGGIVIMMYLPIFDLASSIS